MELIYKIFDNDFISIDIFDFIPACLCTGNIDVNIKIPMYLSLGLFLANMEFKPVIKTVEYSNH